MAKVLLEICCGSAEDAIVAAQNGAHRARAGDAHLARALHGTRQFAPMVRAPRSHGAMLPAAACYSSAAVRAGRSGQA